MKYTLTDIILFYYIRELLSLDDALPIQEKSLHRQASWGHDPVCDLRSPQRSGPRHQGPFCTQCSYELPGGVCVGEYATPLPCASALDWHLVDNGTCRGHRSMCSSRRLCEIANSNSSDGSLWYRSANQTEHQHVTMVPLGREMRNAVLEVALVAAKLVLFPLCVRVCAVAIKLVIEHIRRIPLSS